MQQAAVTAKAGDSYYEHREAIAKANLYLFQRISLCACINMAGLSAISPFLSGFSQSIWLYIVSAALSWLSCVYGYFWLGKRLNAVLPSFYLLLANLCAYGIALSCFFYPEMHGVTIVAIFALIPMVILDRSVRANSVFALLYLAAAVLTFLRKPLLLAIDDCTTSGAFMLFGILIGNHMRKTRLNAIIQQHQTELQRDYDMLTRLPNRRVMFETLGQIDAGKSEQPLKGMLMIDVDDFKSFNDRFGHLAGDECLKSLGTFFKTYADKENMVIYRYGGEEFLGLWYGGENDIDVLANDLIRRAQDLTIGGGSVTLSIGYARCSEGVSCERVISMSDSALYEAKRKGKCQAVAYSPDTMEIDLPASYRQRT